MLLHELEMIHNTAMIPDRLSLLNDDPISDLHLALSDLLWNSADLNNEILRDDRDFDEFDKDVLFRDVHWSAYSSESEYVYIKQEKEDPIDDEEEIKSIVRMGTDGSITPVEIESFNSGDIKPYTPNVDHSYHLVPTPVDLNIVKCEEEERNVDIWNKTEELDQLPSVPFMPPPRKNVRRIRATKSVSINKAANVALKRTRPQITVGKRQKTKNSVETTPSSSDAEDIVKFSHVRDSVFRSRGAKSSAMQALSRIGSTMKVERSSKRSDHNKMEKKRRQELRELYETLKDSIPNSLFRGGNEKVRTNPSKQQILITAKKYVKQLKKDSKLLKEEKRNLKLEKKVKEQQLSALIRE